MKKALIVVLVLAVLGGAGWVVKKRLHQEPAFTTVAYKAALGSIEETVEATGSVSPLNRVEIKPAISGRIEKLLVDEGDTVKQGQIIAWMSSTDRAAILDGARAQGPDVLKKWEDVYKATPIIAPLPGLIILNNVVEGQTVDPTVVIYAMSDILIVEAQVDESDIGKIHIGMPARIVLDSYPNRTEDGKVFDILYEGKNVSNVIQYGVKIKLPRVPSYYRSQMTANISFVIRRKDKALLVPAMAVREKDGVKEVMTPPDQPNGKPQWTEVQTGIENDSSVEIVDGLSAGDQVLVRQKRYVPQQAVASSPLTFSTQHNKFPSGGHSHGG